MGITRFNGYFGCTFSTTLGETINPNNRLHIYRYNDAIPPDEPAVERTDASIRQNAHLAQATNVSQKGVQSISAISIIPGFDMHDGQHVESSHCLWESNFVRWYKVITNPNIVDCINPRKISNICNRVTQARPPTKVARLPCSLENYAHFTGTEYPNLC